LTTSDRLSLFRDELALTGAARYLDAHPRVQEAEPRIYVKFQPVGASSPHLALLDTGAHYCILERQLAESIGGDLTEPIGQRSIRSAHGVIRGDLHIHTLRLIAEIGEPLDVDAVVFVSPDWPKSSFIGYLGVLDRVRFAIDSRANRFFFGAID
jgi:predicted aspartyl protease